MSAKRPLEGNYAATIGVAIAAIAPFIFLGTALELAAPSIAQTLQADATTLPVISGLAIAGYAFGALLGGDIIRRFKQRTLFFICETLFIAGCIVAATAQSIQQYGAGDVLAGLATGLLLVIALPPVVQRFPAKKMPLTSAFINIGFFGAVTAGPLIGGAIANSQAWRLLYFGLAFAGLTAFAFATVTLPDNEPQQPDARFDWSAILLGFCATFLPFWASGELAVNGFGSLWFWAPLVVGLICFAAMIASQLRQEEPLAPVKPMLRTIPFCGILVATFGGGVLVTLMDLAERFEVQIAPNGPFGAGMLFWPAVAGTLLSAAALGVLVRTRWLPLLALGGMVLLVVCAALMLLLPQSGAPALMLFVSALLGVGAGATVAPGLWLAGFSLPSTLLGRLFALIELVRSEGDFIMAPVILQFARSASAGVTTTVNGVHAAAIATLCVAVLVCGAVVWLWFAGGAKLQDPDIEGWLDQSQPDKLALEPGARAA
ncbi:MAG TPA: MFS transporter [Candidatus Baltobacteraceae bacterium]|nr:MFS transporter [Candidatus Baltobacteraceae bacterium]